MRHAIPALPSIYVHQSDNNVTIYGLQSKFHSHLHRLANWTEGELVISEK